MTIVRDAIGRSFEFSRIRFKMDEVLLQQAGSEIVDTEDRGQAVFTRYCQLHLQKYRRNYEPSHFVNGRVSREWQARYLEPVLGLRITVDINDGALFDRYVGMPITEIEAAIRRDPSSWFRAGRVVAIER